VAFYSKRFALYRHIDRASIDYKVLSTGCAYDIIASYCREHKVTMGRLSRLGWNVYCDNSVDNPRGSEDVS